MKNIKYLFLLLVIVLFTGCSVKYDLNIDKDLSVTEKIDATEKETLVKANTGMNTDKAVDYLYDIYKRDNVEPSISKKIKDQSLIATISANYETIDDYVDNFSSDLFNVKLSKSGNLYTLTFKQKEKLSSTSSVSPIYDNVSINISLPYKVTNTNADKMYRNTYTWNLKKDQELTNLKITFDISKKDNSKFLDFGIFKINVKYNVLVMIAIFIIIAVITSIVYYNNKKNNKV